MNDLYQNRFKSVNDYSIWFKSFFHLIYGKNIRFTNTSLEGMNCAILFMYDFNLIIELWSQNEDFIKFYSRYSPRIEMTLDRWYRNIDRKGVSLVDGNAFFEKNTKYLNYSISDLEYIATWDELKSLVKTSIGVLANMVNRYYNQTEKSH